jgi:hypothetical protein
MPDMVKRFANCHRGETCVIIGNGPSLNSTPLDKFERKYITFGSNRIFDLPFTPIYYCIVDELMLKDCVPLPSDFKPVDMFLLAEACVHNNNPIYPINVSGFSPNPANFVVLGGTVTYVMLQLAFFMDFKTVLLVGVDHNYPKSGKLEQGLYFVAGKDDPDHFKTKDGSPYFRKGKQYSAPALQSTTESYKVARTFYEKFGKRIVNLTPGTKLDVFEKGTFDQWI